MVEPQDFKDFWQIITKGGHETSKILLRGIGISALISLISMFLGLGVFLIWSGIFHFIGRFFMYWQPAYTVVRWGLNLSHAPEKLIRMWLPWYRFPILFIHAGLSIVMLYYGFDLLISEGFCGQNLLCMLLG